MTMPACSGRGRGRATALSARPGAGAYRVGADGAGVTEARLQTTPIEPRVSDAPPEDISEFRRLSRARRPRAGRLG